MSARKRRRKTATLVPKGDAGWSGPAGEGGVRFHAEHFSILQKAAKIFRKFSVKSEGKVTLMMASLYNQAGSSPALRLLSFQNHQTFISELSLWSKQVELKGICTANPVLPEPRSSSFSILHTGRPKVSPGTGCLGDSCCLPAESRCSPGRMEKLSWIWKWVFNFSN